jgi:hypothetical protein
MKTQKIKSFLPGEDHSALLNVLLLRFARFRVSQGVVGKPG